jgi:hypothetical protein
MQEAWNEVGSIQYVWIVEEIDHIELETKREVIIPLQFETKPERIDLAELIHSRSRNKSRNRSSVHL